MTKNELSQYGALQPEAKRLRDIIEKLKNQIKRIENEGVVTDSVKGGMGGIERFNIRGFPCREYSRAKTRLCLNQAHLESVEAQLLEIEEFIQSVKDSYLRVILTMTYIDGVKQEDIGKKLHIDRSVISRKMTKYFGD